MTAWLRCKVESGMFSDEAAVTYPRNTDKWQKSVFVPSSCVRGSEPDQGEVKVKVVTKDGNKYAVLPSSQRDIVKVEGSDLVPQ